MIQPFATCGSAMYVFNVSKYERHKKSLCKPVYLTVWWRVSEISPLQCLPNPFPIFPFHNLISCYIFVFFILLTVLNLTNHPHPQQPILLHNLTQLERWSAGTGGGRVAPGKLLGEKISKNSPIRYVLWIFEEYWQQFVEKLQQPTLKAIFSSDST